MISEELPCSNKDGSALVNVSNVVGSHSKEMPAQRIFSKQKQTRQLFLHLAVVV